MAQLENDLLKLKGRAAGLTFYQKGGKTIVRAATSNQPRRMSMAQFRLRQRFLNNNALWRVLKQAGEVFFEGGSSPCHRFRSINTLSPVVFIPKNMRFGTTALLLPDMIVSDGPLPPFSYRLGEVDGQPALLTDLTPAMAQEGRLLLYVFEQSVAQTFGYRLSLTTEQVSLDEAVADGSLKASFVDGCLVLTDSRFANQMMGFALVRVVDGHASRQQVVTRCTCYQQFTTDDALQTAAKSYGGLTHDLG